MFNFSVSITMETQTFELLPIFSPLDGNSLTKEMGRSVKKGNLYEETDIISTGFRSKR